MTLLLVGIVIGTVIGVAVMCWLTVSREDKPNE